MERNQSAEARLCDELEGFCKKEGLPHLSAGDLRHHEGITDEQRGWLDDFIERWDEEVDSEGIA